MTETADRSEIEAAFRNYFMTGIVGEDWVAWSQLFTDDAVYHDHYWGTFHGPKEIQGFLESTMCTAPMVYTVMKWYVIDGNRLVWEGINRADNPEPGGEPLGFPSMQIMTYGGDGKWSSEEDWWVLYEMQRFGAEYSRAASAHDSGHAGRMTRDDWGPWVDWARPPADHVARPSWLGRADVRPARTLADLHVGTRNPRI